MHDRQNARPTERPSGLALFERGTNAACGLVLIVAALLISIGAYQFCFGSEREIVSSGLDAMSGGILIALAGVTAYICLFAIGLIIANVIEQKALRNHA